MMDIGLMMKLGGILSKFNKNHPKVMSFINTVKSSGMPVDTIIDLKVTYPDGKSYDTNLKIMQSDLDMIEELKKLKK